MSVTRPREGETERRRVGALANVAVLERELGGVVHQLHRLGPAASAERAELEARRDGLLALLDAERARQERQGRSA